MAACRNSWRTGQRREAEKASKRPGFQEIIGGADREDGDSISPFGEANEDAAARSGAFLNVVAGSVGTGQNQLCRHLMNRQPVALIRTYAAVKVLEVVNSGRVTVGRDCRPQQHDADELESTLRAHRRLT